MAVEKRDRHLFAGCQGSAGEEIHELRAYIDTPVLGQLDIRRERAAQGVVLGSEPAVPHLAQLLGIIEFIDPYHSRSTQLRVVDELDPDYPGRLDGVTVGICESKMHGDAVVTGLSVEVHPSGQAGDLDCDGGEQIRRPVRWKILERVDLPVEGGDGLVSPSQRPVQSPIRLARFTNLVEESDVLAMRSAGTVEWQERSGEAGEKAACTGQHSCHG